MHGLCNIDHQALEGLAEEYASAVIARQALVAAIRERLAAITSEMAPALREALRAERGARAELEIAVTAAPTLFSRPRTRVTHGIRYGWRTTSAVIEIPDEAATVAKIERLIPEEQQALLLRRTVRVHKPAVLDLTAADLRRLGIRQVPGEDGVIVKPLADDTDRLVDALLADAEEAAHE